MNSLGNIKIFFGKIVDINDDMKINRCRVKIDGYTDEIDDDKLPWYYPWYGIFYLPQIGDEVPVIIFDENFTTCFYGYKVDLTDSELDSGDYENYLEIFKRSVDEDVVELTYKKSSGIEFINKNSKVQIEKDKITFFVNSNSILIEKNKIFIGDKNQEASLLGDKSVKHLQNIIKHQNNTITKFIQLFTSIASAAAQNPMTSAIGAAITSILPTIITELNTENIEVNTESTTIQSKKTFIE